MTTTQAKALRYPVRNPSAPADLIGSHLWPDRTGRVCASHGGGDYKAQQYLGRLRARGWVERDVGWFVTSAGRTALDLHTEAVRPCR